MSVRMAADETVEALRGLGRLEKVDAAVVAAYLELADQIDNISRGEVGKAGLFKEFRNYHDALIATGGNDGDDITGLLDRLSAEMGNPTPPRTTNSG